MRAWIDGDLLADPTQGAIAVTDHGFTVGDGVFEAVKTLDGVPFALTRHLARLERSASGLGLPDARPDVVRRGVASRARRRAGRPDGSAADHLDRRDRTRWGRDAAGDRRRWWWPTAPSTDAAPETTVVTVPWTRNENGATAGLKTTSYAENVDRAGARPPARRDRGDPRQHGRQPLRGHGVERVLRRRR